MTNHPFHGRRILVTGGSGFIGGRLIDYLVAGGAKVRSLIHRNGPAVRLARLPIEMISGDLLDPESIAKAVAGCDVVFHCAYGSSGEDSLRRLINVEGTVNLIRESSRHKVKRFVHVSTIAVHGPDPGPVVDETAPIVESGNAYADSKAEAERKVFQLGKELGVPVTVVRPTIVYGPRSPAWTTGPLARMKAGTFSLIGNGNGLANHVYVDDVVQALLLSAVHPEAIGEAFIVSEGNPVSWQEFFSYYAGLLELKSLPKLDLDQIHQELEARKALRNPLWYGLSFAASPHAQNVLAELTGIGSATQHILDLMPAQTRTRIALKADELRELKLTPPPSVPSQWAIDMFSSQSICRIDKAKQMLGYQPKFTLDEGMRLTGLWIRETGLV